MVSFGLSGEPVRGKTLLSPEPRALRVPYENSAPASNQRLALNFVAYATKFRHGRSRIEGAQLSPGFPEHFDTPPPRVLPLVIGRQNSFRQERIVRHRVQQRVALRRRPAQQRPGSHFVPQCPARSLVKDFQVPGIASVDALEIPRACDDFRVGFPRARPRLQQDKRFHIDLAAAKDSLFFRQRIGRDPQSVLQVTEGLADATRLSITPRARRIWNWRQSLSPRLAPVGRRAVCRNECRGFGDAG